MLRIQVYLSRSLLSRFSAQFWDYSDSSLAYSSQEKEEISRDHRQARWIAQSIAHNPNQPFWPPQGAVAMPLFYHIASRPRCTWELDSRPTILMTSAVQQAIGQGRRKKFIDMCYMYHCVIVLQSCPIMTYPRSYIAGLTGKLDFQVTVSIVYAENDLEVLIWRRCNFALSIGKYM